MSAVKVRKKPLTKRCQKGYPCKTTCINRDKNCRNPLKWQAKDLAGWLKLQEERLAVTNQKRSRVGLSPATMNDQGYITADRIKRSGSVKSVEPKESPVTTASPSEKPTVAKMFAHAVKGGVIQAVGLKGDDYQFTYRKKEGIAKPHIELRNLATGEIKKVPMTQKAFRDYLSRLDDVSPANARLVDGFSDQPTVNPKPKEGDRPAGTTPRGVSVLLNAKDVSGVSIGFNQLNNYVRSGEKLKAEEKLLQAIADAKAFTSSEIGAALTKNVVQLSNGRYVDPSRLNPEQKQAFMDYRAEINAIDKEFDRRSRIFTDLVMAPEFKDANLPESQKLEMAQTVVKNALEETSVAKYLDFPKPKEGDRSVESKPENSDRPSPVPNAGEQLKYNELTKLRHRALLGMSKGRTPKDSRELYDRVQSELNEFEKRFPDIKHTITQNEREKAQWDKTESEGLKTLSAYQAKLAKKSTQSQKEEKAIAETHPYESTLNEFIEQEKQKLLRAYPSASENQSALKMNAEKAKDKWLASLNDYAQKGRLSDRVIDSFVETFGEKDLNRTFRGVTEKGIQGWVPKDLRGDRASVVPELVKEKRPHPSEMSISDKLTELLEHYESANPIPQFRKGLSGKYAAVGSDGSTYGKQYETEADGINAAKEYQKQRVEDSYSAVRKMSEKQIDRQVEYWRKQRGIETNSAPPTPTPPSDSTYQPTAKEFGDRLNVTAEDFKGNALYLGVAPDSGGYGYSDRDKEWIKSKYGDVNYGDEYRIVKEGDSIAIEKRSIVYKKDGDPINDRLSEEDWKSWYGKQNISWNQESLVSKIANFNITEKPHPLVTNANADKEKRRIQKEKAEKERQIKAEQQQAELTAWTAIKKEMVKALPKPKQKQSVTWMGEDGKDRNGIADLYGDNYAITRLVGSRGNGRFSVADVSSGFLTYKSGLTAAEAKELLGILWKERGDKPIMKGESLDISDDLLEVVGRYGYSDAIPKIYSQAVTDRLNAGKEQKAQALQSNLFGGLDEIPVDEKREAAIAQKVSKETDKRYRAIEKYRPYVKPKKKDKMSDAEFQRRIDESNEYFEAITSSNGKKFKKIADTFYQDGEPGDRFYLIDVEKIFKKIDDYQKTGNKEKIVLDERIDSSSPEKGMRREIPMHELDPSDENAILDFMRDNMNIKVGDNDTIADVRERFDAMQELRVKGFNTSRPEWMKDQIASVDEGKNIEGLGLTPTVKSFIAEQLYNLNAFDFPAKADYDGKEPPMITVRLPGNQGQYKLYKTREAINAFLKGAGIAPKEGELVIDALKRNSKKAQDFSELTISPRDRHLLLLATTAANRILEYPEFLRQGILNRLGGLA